MNPLVTEIARLVDNTKDVTFRVGTAINSTTVRLHGGVQINVSKWVSYPGDNGMALVLLLKGTVIGFGLNDGFTQASADAKYVTKTSAESLYVNTSDDTLDGTLTTTDREGGALVDPMLSNALAYAVERGSTISCTTTGTVTVGGLSGTFAGPQTWVYPTTASYTAVVGGASGGTLTITVSTSGTMVEPVVVPANAYWTAFMQWRMGIETGITAIKSEIQGTDGTWTTAETGGVVPANALYQSPSTGVASYPPKGVRFTFNVAGGVTYYLRQVGLWHRSMPLGSAAYLPKGGGNVYGTITQAIPGAAAVAIPRMYGPYSVTTPTMANNTEVSVAYTHSLGVTPSVVVAHLEDGNWASAVSWRVAKTSTTVTFYCYNNHASQATVSAVIKFYLIV